jgi:copper homeostasis protein
MVKKFILEAVVDSLDAALAAQTAGADRLELCSGLELGGLTPGIGLIREVCRRVHIPVCVLIRTRGGNFECTQTEFETLLLEAEAAREAGAAGIVAGILNADRRIDVARMKLLVEAASPLPVTFHRAFDRARDREEALADLLETGCQRLLSSGMAATAFEGAEHLKWLRDKAAGQIVIMPGGGITPSNIIQIAVTTSAVEFHCSAIQWMDEQRWVPHPEKISDIQLMLQELVNTSKEN